MQQAYPSLSINLSYACILQIIVRVAERKAGGTNAQGPSNILAPGKMLSRAHPGVREAQPAPSPKPERSRNLASINLEIVVLLT